MNISSHQLLQIKRNCLKPDLFSRIIRIQNIWIELQINVYILYTTAMNKKSRLQSLSVVVVIII